MMKISALDLMKKNYNTNIEAEKLKQFFFNVSMFQKSDMFRNTQEFSYSKFFDSLILRNWKHRQTYITVKDMLEQNNLYIDFSKKYENEQLINFIEIINNVLSYKPNIDFIKMNYGLYIIEDRYKLMLEILDALIKNLGLSEKKNPDEWIVLIPQNETLDKVIEDFKPELQWEVVSYLKIKSNDLESKRKQLAYLATELYIEQDKEEKGYKPFETIMSECTLILNNLHIRHNNKTGKWENEVVKNLNQKDSLEYCDILYNKMLQIVLMRKNLKQQTKINELSQNLKVKK